MTNKGILSSKHGVYVYERRCGRGEFKMGLQFLREEVRHGARTHKFPNRDDAESRYVHEFRY